MFFSTAHAWTITLYLLQIIVSVVIDKLRGVLKSCKKIYIDVSWELGTLWKLVRKLCRQTANKDVLLQRKISCLVITESVV